VSVNDWSVRLSSSAEADFRELLHWTLIHFGQAQARVYAGTVAAALKDLRAGPTIPGTRQRSDIGRGILTLHVARNGRKGRHFVMFRASESKDEKFIDVLRILHDAMDLRRHLPPD
jgi:toxin ParE1/3/4